MKRFAPLKQPYILAGLLIASLFIGHFSGERWQCADYPKGLICLAFDGCDPVVVSQLMAQGKLPNFSRLAQEGSFQPLATTLPPQSPVAWSTFISGKDASEHGIYDFLHRDLQTMKVVPSLTRVVDGVAQRNRSGPPFWEPLLARGIPCTFLKLPADYPPTQDKARKLSGMGVPDLLGSYGTFTEYRQVDAALEPLTRKGSGSAPGGTVVPISLDAQGQTRACLIGPGQTGPEFSLKLDKLNQTALLELGNLRLVLQPNVWSDWTSLNFQSPAGTTPGMLRFCLLSIEPLRLYASPVNFDPGQPAQTISTPANYAPHLCRCCGPFHTQGMAEDTKALGSGTLDDDQYLAQSALVAQESRRLFEVGLEEFQGGLLFCYSSSIDLQSHMYWGAWDAQHPLHQKAWAKKHPDVIEKAYQEADAWVGRAMKYRQEHPERHLEVVALSDHGFAPFYRSFDLNAWLAEQGYLSLSIDSPLESADWSATKAYAVGFNGLYLNRVGREKAGILDSQQADKLALELQQKLLNVQDQGKPVFSRVLLGKQVYLGSRASQSPDLILGYQRGYRAAWETALGQRSAHILRDNLEHWSGDHLIDPQLVPGVLFYSRKLGHGSAGPSLQEIGPAIVHYFLGPPSGPANPSSSESTLLLE